MHYCVTPCLCQRNLIFFSGGHHRPKGLKVKFQSYRAPFLLNPTFKTYLVIYFLLQCHLGSHPKHLEELKSYLLKREMNLRLPVSTTLMILSRWWEVGLERKRIVPPLQRQRKSCPTLKNKGLDSYFGKRGFGLWILCKQKWFMIAVSRYQKM